MEPRYECNCDAVIGMEEIGVGTEEILQYAAAVLPRRSLRHLIRGLEAILGESAEDYAACDHSESGESSESPTALSEVAT